MAVTANAGDFEAWIDRQPGRNNQLTVQGSVTVPSLGWSGTLVEAVPQGINPNILILEAQLTAPGGPSGSAISKIALHFEKPNSPNYTDVQIRGLGDDFTIPVKDVH